MKKLLLLLFLLPALAFGQATGYTLSDFATSGSIGTAASTVDVYSRININQTTPSITLTVPKPTNQTTKVTEVWIGNKGTVPFTLVPGSVIDTGKFVILKWIGDKYSVVGAGSSINIIAESPLSFEDDTLSIPQASNSTDGYLSSANWNTFALKQKAIVLTTTGTGAATLTPGFVQDALNIPTPTVSALGGMPISGGTFTGNVNGVTPTELGYVAGATSNIQTQLNGKQATIGYTPENVANKATDFTTVNNTLYPSIQAVKSQLDTKIVAESTGFVTGAISPYFKNKSYAGTLIDWSFVTGTTGWNAYGSGSTWTLVGSNIQVSGGGGASDFSNQYRYNPYQFCFEGQETEIVNFIPTVNATNTGEGIGVGVRNNDALSDIVVRFDLSNSGTRGQLKIFRVASGTATLLGTSATNLSFTTNVDNISLQLNRRYDGLEAKVVNNTTGLSVTLLDASTSSTSIRVSKLAMWHFGGTVLIPQVKLKNSNSKYKKYLLIGDSVTNGYGAVYRTISNNVYVSAGSGARSSDIINCVESLINSGAENAVIMIGMNDAVASVSTSDYMTNVRIVVNACRSAGMGITICYVTPSSDGPRNVFIQGYNTALSAEYNGVYTIVDTYSLLSIDGTLTGILNTIYDADGTHPNANGYARLADFVRVSSGNAFNAQTLNVTNTGYEENQIFMNIGTPTASTGGWSFQNGGSPTTYRALRGYLGTTETITFDPSSNSKFSYGLSVGVLGGNLGVGVSSASTSARVHIAGGTTTLPAIRLSSGVLTTTPLAGAIEYDGTKFYLTPSGRYEVGLTTGLTSGVIPVATTSGRLTNAAGLGYTTADSTLSLQHLRGIGGAPTISAGAGAGTGPTVSIVAGSTDLSGVISITTGTATVPSSVVATVTFNTNYGSAPKVLIVPANLNAQVLSGTNGCYVDRSTITSSGFPLNSFSGLSVSTTYEYHYIITK